MSDSVPDGSMRSLYETFVRALDKGADLSSFSKDDLLDIYDYSRGLEDDYVSAEALKCGEKYYSGSRELAERRVIFYFDLQLDVMAEKAVRKLPTTSIVRRFMDFRSEGSKDCSLNRLKEAIGDVRKGSIEDVILLFVVDVLTDMGLRNSVVNNAEYLSSVSQYPTSIYSELYRSSYELGEYEQAEKYARILTEMEPFVLEYWVNLSNILANNLNEPQQALEAAEFALAIDPTSFDALLSKAGALFYSSPQDAEKIVDSLLKTSPSEPSVLFMKTFLLYKNGHDTEAEDVLNHYLSQGNTIDKDGFAMLFYYRGTYPDGLVLEALKDLIRKESHRSALDWASLLAVNGLYVGALAVVREGKRLGILDENYEVFLLELSMMYRLRLYSNVIDAYRWNKLYLKNIDSSALDLVYALSLLAVGEPEQARMAARKCLDSEVEYRQANPSDIVGELMGNGARAFLVKLIEWLDGAKIEEWEYNPFVTPDLS